MAMLLIGFVLLFALGRIIGRRLGWSRHRRMALAVVAGIGGLGLGILAVTATFLGSTWAPAPRLRIDVPNGFAPHWVILLEDSSAPSRLVWHGYRAPFHGVTSELTVPPGGIVRVQSPGYLKGRGDTQIDWSDGTQAVGFATLPVPAAVHATALVAYQRQVGTSFSLDDLPAGNALSSYIRAHGG